MFPSLEYADLALWTVAGYSALSTLVRLAVHERHRLIDQYRERTVVERRRHAQGIHERQRQEAARRTARHRDTAA